MPKCDATVCLQIDKCAPVYICIGDGGNEEVHFQCFSKCTWLVAIV